MCSFVPIWIGDVDRRVHSNPFEIRVSPRQIGYPSPSPWLVIRYPFEEKSLFVSMLPASHSRSHTAHSTLAMSLGSRMRGSSRIRWTNQCLMNRKPSRNLILSSWPRMNLRAWAGRVFNWPSQCSMQEKCATRLKKRSISVGVFSSIIYVILVVLSRVWIARRKEEAIPNFHVQARKVLSYSRLIVLILYYIIILLH